MHILEHLLEFRCILNCIFRDFKYIFYGFIVYLIPRPGCKLKTLKTIRTRNRHWIKIIGFIFSFNTYQMSDEENILRETIYERDSRNGIYVFTPRTCGARDNTKSRARRAKPKFVRDDRFLNRLAH